MDDFARLPETERRVYFEQAAERDGRMTSQLMEKDFWVCWTLKRLFALNEFASHLTFKGGTSLSKVYQAIDRFSEDIDISIEREFLGFGGDDDPEKGSSGKEQQRRINRLKETCQTAVADKLYPQLHSAVSGQLNNEEWHLTLDADDPDGQTISFHFPPSIRADLSPYFAPSVKIEIGARSDHFPVHDATISSYLEDSIPDAVSSGIVSLRVLAVERTFWEKATILHMLYHWPDQKPVQPRMSRHYFDLFRLADGDIIKQSMDRIDLLDRVAVHKSVYFKSAWANYREAKIGSLRLIPRAERMSELRSDYRDMEPMFFAEPPSFDQIIDRLIEVENQINATPT